ncbi:preprotein translocase subunit SecA, partial [bacterium]|nr:preprotein translocase subunit SecA [bacterium]
DYNIDEKLRVATLSENGIQKMEKALKVDNIYAKGGFRVIHHIEQALKAKALFKRDVDYVVKDNEVLIVDEFTGRLMPGRRYSEGLHQAIEAKERVKIQRESKTLASITFQNYFRLFQKLSGMTGTAKTEEEEFYKIYGLKTVVIPTNQPILRQDLQDFIYKSRQTKYKAIADKVAELYYKGQPILVGTSSVEQSEVLSQVLKLKGVKHEVLNAKNHAREAEIVAAAGQKSAVTIATNMAGRGTDIKLGEGVMEVGGLYIIGTQRNESRRVDNQLRGRSGRQGDVGTSQFYLSLEDDLMRIFGGDRVQRAMTALNVPDDMPIQSRFISSAIEKSQTRVEGRNFDMRKHVVEYDDVINYHREIVYKKRRQVLASDSIKANVLDYLQELSNNLVFQHKQGKTYDYREIFESINAIHEPGSDSLQLEQLQNISDERELREFIFDFFVARFNTLVSNLNQAKLNDALRFLYLNTIDTFWMEHIDDMGYLRQNVSLHAYGQKDPLVEYKQQAYLRFKDLLVKIRFGFVSSIFKALLEK